MSNKMTLSGPMFEPADDGIFKSPHKKRGAHYNHYSVAEENGMRALREIFPEGEADEFNLCLFSTSGVHGMYTKIEQVEAHVLHGENEWGDDGGPDSVTFLIIQPRLCCLRYGNCMPKTPADFIFLKQLRKTSWAEFQKIG